MPLSLEQFGEHIRDLVEYVPVQELEGLAGNVPSRGKLGPIIDSLQKGGEIREPIVINYHPKTGHTFIGEGNNRVAAAKALGIPEVPAVVQRTAWTKEEREDHAKGQSGMLAGGTRPPYSGDDWFGADETPSRAGFSGRRPG